MACDFCSSYKGFAKVGIQEGTDGTHHLYFNYVPVKAEERFNFCPRCGRPLTEADFQEQPPPMLTGCPVGKMGCIHNPAGTPRCNHLDLDESGNCWGYQEDDIYGKL